MRGRKSEPKNGHSMLCACGMHRKCEEKRTSNEAGGRRETRDVAGRCVEERCADGGLLGGGGEPECGSGPGVYGALRPRGNPSQSHVAVPSGIAGAPTWYSRGLSHVTRGICLTRACQFCCCGSGRARCVFASILLILHRAQCNLHPAPPPHPPDPPRRLIRTRLFRSIPRQKSLIPHTDASYA